MQNCCSTYRTVQNKVSPVWTVKLLMWSLSFPVYKPGDVVFGSDGLLSSCKLCDYVENLSELFVKAWRDHTGSVDWNQWALSKMSARRVRPPRAPDHTQRPMGCDQKRRGNNWTVEKTQSVRSDPELSVLHPLAQCPTFVDVKKIISGYRQPMTELVFAPTKTEAGVSDSHMVTVWHTQAWIFSPQTDETCKKWTS